MTQPILILGSSGYMGSAFVKEIRSRGMVCYSATRDFDHYHYPSGLPGLLDELKPSLVINAAAYIPAKSVDLCKDDPFNTITGNVALPAMLARECALRDILLMHLSTACLFNEEKLYTEEDTPTRGWDGYCGFYVGSKLTAEKIVSMHPKHYILRLRLPFDEVDNPRNYLSKLASFPRVFKHVNSLTHRGDFVKAALDLWDLKAPFGTYTVCNPGFISATVTAQMMMEKGIATKCPMFVDDPKTTGCTLSVNKLLSAGVKIRDVNEALNVALTNWKAAHV